MIRAGFASVIAALAFAGAVSADTTPVCPPGEACDPPMAGVGAAKPTSPTTSTSTTNVQVTLAGLNRVYVVFSRASVPVMRIHASRVASTFHLAPGAYAIRLASPQGRIIKPAKVLVPSSGTVHLKLVVQPKP